MVREWERVIATQQIKIQRLEVEVEKLNNIIDEMEDEMTERECNDANI